MCRILVPFYSNLFITLEILQTLSNAMFLVFEAPMNENKHKRSTVFYDMQGKRESKRKNHKYFEILNCTNSKRSIIYE